MPYFQELRQVPYGAEQMFGIVADIESYPAFLPWCVGARVLERRAAEEAALKFAQKNQRRPWASSGKVFVGLTLEEKKAGQQYRAEMLRRSLLGYEQDPAMPPATTDDAPR